MGTYFVKKIFIELSKMTWLSMLDTPENSYFIMPITLDCFHKMVSDGDTVGCDIFHQERNDLGEITKRTIGYFDEKTKLYKPLFEITGPEYTDGDIYIGGMNLKEI
jgi:hypothetical protein